MPQASSAPLHPMGTPRPGLPFNPGQAPAPVRMAPPRGPASTGVQARLRFDLLAGFYRIEDFEDHLQNVLGSGTCVFFDGEKPLLLSGRPLAGLAPGLRLEIRSTALAPRTFHILGPGMDASFALADGIFLAGESNRRRIDLIRYWYGHAKPHLIRVWQATRSPRGPMGPPGRP